MHPMRFREVARSVSEEAVRSDHRFGREPSQRNRDRVATQNPSITILVPWAEPDFFDEYDEMACSELAIDTTYLFVEAAGFMSLLEAEYDTPNFMAMMDMNYDTVWQCMWDMFEAIAQDQKLMTVQAYEAAVNEHIHTIVHSTGRLMEWLARTCTGFAPPRPGMYPLHTYIDNAEWRPGVGVYISFDFSEAYQGL